MIDRLERGDLPPAIVVPPPGPQSRALSRRLAASEAPGINTLGAADEPALVWREALGSNVLDVDGNLFVDLTAGFGVATIGHRHPRVVAAVAAQAERLLHGLGDVAAHPLRVALAERLVALAPVDDGRVHFAVSGADAIEIALKTALAATGRPGILAFEPGYHGVTLGALAVSSRDAFRRPFAAQLHPHVRRLPFGCAPDALARALASEEIGAVVVEPVVGREGVILPPAGWLAALAALARARGALFVADEIFTGFGRTGTLFAVDVEGVRPDLLCCGKALGGGLPIAAVIGERRRMEVWRGPGEALHTGTFVAHPLACAAALATLDVIADEKLVERAARGATLLGEPLASLAGRHASVLALRGRGFLWGLAMDSPARAKQAAAAARARGVLLLAGGAGGDVLQIAPPLAITAGQLAAAVALLDESLAEAGRA